MTSNTRCGYIAILGRPNVGKSTLINAMLGKKLSIVSHKRQTTRHNILGVKTTGDIQAVYIDTPGMHKGAKRALNRYMNKMAGLAIHDVDVIVFMIEVLRWTSEDEMILEKLKSADKPVILAVNKIDEVKEKDELLPFLSELSEKFDFTAIVPVAAKKRKNLDELESLINKLLPENPFFFDKNQLTDRSEAFLISETIREKLFHAVHQEIPYSTAIGIEKIEHKNNVMHIYATIYVEKKGQKIIIIGEKGEQIKRIGQNSRIELEKKYKTKVFLQLWVKVKDQWADSERALRDLGFTHD